jgi:hypothetical protein
MEIRPISSEVIKPYIEEAKKESLTFCQKTRYIGCFENGTLIGFAGVLIHKNSVTFKNGFILKPFRGKGYYKAMFIYRINLFRGMTITANCTPMSIRLYLRSKFKIIKEYKNGIKKVIYKENK